ncbi:AhpC/TSA family protein [Pedobacter sp. MC2016-14]|uniref:TlpA family protein disulfide reductase n=1 Tax=Pedobacter sp. MC2016-14 TaxID=2897327 RepID=UPI001E4B9FD3|nr:thioredoxin fold domain-containing protein [Pedobacter sp. MC2016-14]MCD0489536.1 AhpC/TSA family protein [Pedobacter sp. MC2016-14]
MKKWLTIAWLTTLMVAIGAFFWYNQFVYSLPTPVPSNYRTVNPGEKIPLSDQIRPNNNKPVFLHFFNPDCPCSRFNIDQFKALVKTYQDQLNFAVILMSAKRYKEAEIQSRFGITVPVYTDSTLASTCGVYSTPQAVLIKEDQTLYYRGNYNKSRYCTDMKTNYAKMAIEGIVKHTKLDGLDKYALKAYGCTLPNCEK